MRPIKLELQYFGPFKSETIDFSELHGKMFLLTGPTGSGKSMIFNAILYALYGSDTRNKSLRSQFANETDKSTVCLEFEMGNKQYRVERTMGIPREDMSDVPPKAFLKSHDGASIATGVKAVTDAVQTIIHLNEHQFKQILMLPQGAFKEFLVSSSDDKSKILSTLFHAQRFINFEKELEFSMKDKKRGLEAAQVKLDHLFSQVKFGRLEDDDGRFERYEQSAGVEAQLSFIEDVNKETEKYIEAKDSALTETKNALDSMTKSIHEREAHNIEVEKFLHVKSRQVELNNNHEKIAQLKVKVEQCKRAKIMHHQLKAYEKLADSKTKNLEQIKETDIKIEALNTRLKDSNEAYEQLIEQAPRMEEMLTFIQDTRQFIAEEYEILDNSMTKTRTEVERLTKEAESISTEVKELEATRDQLATGYEDETAVKKQLDNVERSLAQLNEQLHYNTLTSKMRELDNRIDETRLKLRKYLDDNKGLYSRDDQHAIEHLKQHLTVGDDCPVCQQVLIKLPEHHYFDDDVEQEILELNAQIETLNNEHQKLSIAQQLCKERIIDFKDIQTDTLIQHIDEETSLRTSLTEKIGEMDRQRKSHLKVLETLNMLAGTLSELNSHYHKASGHYERLKDSKKLFVKTSGQENYQDFIREYNQCIETAETFDFKKEQLNKDIDTCNKELALASQTSNYLQEEQTRLDSEYTALSQELDAFIEAEDISNISMLHTLIHTDTSHDEDEINAHDDAVRTVRTQLDIHYENQTTEYKDISDEDKKALETLKHTYEEASRHLTLLHNDFHENQKLYDTFSKSAQSLSDELAAFNQHFKIYEIVAGKGPQGISLHRFVLTYHLDRVLEQANIRLEEMTNARYSLIRTTEANRKGAAAGLEIRVHDSFSGTMRHVDTLSGGETFQASLALALAINEIIIQSSGGIQLDTILIDEGFGTLDQETLNQAIESLLSLETSGKMVGIISHVEELKHQLEYKIEVVPNNETSTTRLHV